MPITVLPRFHPIGETARDKTVFRLAPAILFLFCIRMSTDVILSGAALSLRPSGALFWPEARLLCVSDLHLGKSARMARRGVSFLPPYETQDTLARLDQEISRTGADVVICLGDSFDDPRACEDLKDTDALWLMRLMAGRRWIWIEGNHDPGPIHLGGSHMAEYQQGPLRFRHIATPGAMGEVSGHYHPKLRVKGGGRPCFLLDRTRLILPAFGTYTGGLFADDPALTALFSNEAQAILTGKTPGPFPLYRRAKRSVPPVGVLATKKKPASSL